MINTKRLTFAAMATLMTTCAFADWQEQQFFDGQRTITFSFDASQEVRRIDPHIKTLRSELEALFSDQGWSLEPRSKMADPNALGVPVVFRSKTGTAPAILTNEIVVQSAHMPWQILCPHARAKKLPLLRHTFLVKLPSPEQALQCATSLSHHPAVSTLTPNFHLALESRQAKTYDPLVEKQWHLENRGQSAGAPGADAKVLAAWEIERGVKHPLIAVLDLGFEREHPELMPQWYINNQEIPNNKQDDDGNGLVDDVSGWNFSIDGPNILYGQAPNHGTATSGIIAAAEDGKGTTGVCPGCRLLPIVVDGRPAQDAMAVLYAMKQGAVILTNSWGYKIGTPQTKIVSDALTKVAREGRNGLGIPILFAMNNAALNVCRSENPDISAHPDVIAISAVDHMDKKVPESGYGPCLKLVAPSAPYPAGTKGIVTTDRTGNKGYNTGSDVTNLTDLNYTNTFSGTSAATPIVAGVFGLLASQSPEQSAAMWLQRVIKSAEKIQPAIAKYDENGHSDLYGFGRLDARKALEMHDATQ